MMKNWSKLINTACHLVQSLFWHDDWTERAPSLSLGPPPLRWRYFTEAFGVRKLEISSLSCWLWLVNDQFGRINTNRACERRTDRETESIAIRYYRAVDGYMRYTLITSLHRRSSYVVSWRVVCVCVCVAKRREHNGRNYNTTSISTTFARQ